MRVGRPSPEELRHNFAAELESVLADGGMRSESGLDMEVEEALWAIARARPDVPVELVAAAYRAFAGQLDGGNARARRAELERRLEEMKRRHPPRN
ncbi:hypothetical protein [Actinomadura sp. WMMB 499]|uniref:hypothetical protein n=1 Tax=Actinomadura sp. WMMB 499 TaxID=1219491 RepID=UPI001243A340|nr:hypothetical protein [Actinomadura sp. WMMB 499]QFG20644.1 hypothetical protein F7P10_05260 [Actinomadura sp. WMMB 499]